MQPTFALVACEPSADVFGAQLIQQLRQRWPDAKFEGVAGPLMRQAGCAVLRKQEDLAVMGLFEVLKHLPRILEIRRQLVAHWSVHKPDLFIGLDAPDFNLGLERILKTKGVTTVHYVSPSVWAWRSGRVKTVQAATHHLFCIFPFEVPFYQKFQVPATYVGHPLAQTTKVMDVKHAQGALGLVEGEYLTLLPGSRMQELQRMLPLYLETAKAFSAQTGAKILIAFHNQAACDAMEPLWSRYAAVQCIVNNTPLAIAAARAVLATSGTVTLEVMLLERPMVVAYKMHALTYQIAKRVVKTPWIALPNILAGQLIVPECIQENATPPQLIEKLQALWRMPEAQVVALAPMREQLQQPAAEVVPVIEALITKN